MGSPLSRPLLGKVKMYGNGPDGAHGLAAFPNDEAPQ